MIRQIVKGAGRALLVVIAGTGCLLFYMLMFEDQYIYFPGRELLQTPAGAGLPFKEIQFETADGISLHGWFMPATDAVYTVLHFHGNAGNISHRLSLYRQWHDLGLSVFAFDYRGYGKSGGKPSEHGLYEDARAAWKALTTMDEGKGIIIAGRSLGASVAARLAAEVRADGLVLETPFSSIPDMAAYHYPLLPLKWMARSRFDTRAIIPEVQMPLLVISARDDRIVPAGMAEQILAAANEPKVHLSLPGGHNDFDLLSGKAYSRLWREWVTELGL